MSAAKTRYIKFFVCTSYVCVSHKRNILKNITHLLLVINSLSVCLYGHTSCCIPVVWIHWPLQGLLWGSVLTLQHLIHSLLKARQLKLGFPPHRVPYYRKFALLRGHWSWSFVLQQHLQAVCQESNPAPGKSVGLLPWQEGWLHWPRSYQGIEYAAANKWMQLHCLLILASILFWFCVIF